MGEGGRDGVEGGRMKNERGGGKRENEGRGRLRFLPNHRMVRGGSWTQS